MKSKQKKVNLLSKTILFTFCISNVICQEETELASYPCTGSQSPVKRFSCWNEIDSWTICRECNSLDSKMCQLKSSPDCKCRHISIDGKGGSDCKSSTRGRNWCYIDAESSCDDIAKSKSSVVQKEVLYLEDDLYYSEEACEEFNQTQYDEEQKELGNEEFIVDVTLSRDNDLTTDFGGGGITTETPEQCQAECLARENVCFGWTFDEYNGTTGTCYLKNDQVCCDQINKKICKVGSVSGFSCTNRKEGSACWSTHGDCPCDANGVKSEFCSGCDETKSQSSTVGLQGLRRCERNRHIFSFINGKWRKIATVVDRCDNQ